MFIRALSYVRRRLDAAVRLVALHALNSKHRDLANQLRYPRPAEGQVVPKQVFQIFLGHELPLELVPHREALIARNPGWSFQLFDDATVERYINTHFPTLLPLYHRIDPRYSAARTDFFRYLLIYREGGVYLDVKSTFTRPLDEVLRDKHGFVLSNWDNQTKGTPHYRFGTHLDIPNRRGEFLQCVLAAPAGHPFLRAVIDNVVLQVLSYSPRFHGVGREGVLRTTGPIAFTKPILKILHLHPYTYCDLFSEGFVYSVLEEGMHHRLSKVHYSELRLPVVQPSAT